MSVREVFFFFILFYRHSRQREKTKQKQESLSGRKQARRNHTPSAAAQSCRSRKVLYGPGGAACNHEPCGAPVRDPPPSTSENSHHEQDPSPVDNCCTGKERARNWNKFWFVSLGFHFFSPPLSHFYLSLFRNFLRNFSFITVSCPWPVFYLLHRKEGSRREAHSNAWTGGRGGRATTDHQRQDGRTCLAVHV